MLIPATKWASYLLKQYISPISFTSIWWSFFAEYDICLWRIGKILFLLVGWLFEFWKCGHDADTENEKPRRTFVWRGFWCPGQDSNLHERNCSLPPQSSVSTNFTTWALLSRINFRECKYRHYFAIRKIFAEKTTKFAWGPPGSFCGGPGMLYLSVISLSR